MSSIGDEGDLGPPTAPRFKGLASKASNEQRFADLPTAGQTDPFDLAVLESVGSCEDDRVLISFDAVHEVWEEKRGAKLTDEKPFDSQSKVAARMFEWRSSKVWFTWKLCDLPCGRFRCSCVLMTGCLCCSVFGGQRVEMEVNMLVGLWKLALLKNLEIFK
jgi:hypothetical protein